jgi:5S rRNA maturation endonuclease (ribonuclease M5)
MDKQAIETHFGGNYYTFYSRFLPNLKKSGTKGLKALCPFHDDHKPSLSIDNSKGLYKCFGCDASGDIFNFYAMQNNLAAQSDFPKILEGIAQEFGITNGDKKEKSKVIIRYNYHDESGVLQYQIERLDPKKFQIRRPNGNGGWIYKKEDVRIVPYHLPDIIKAKEVIIVEGEKDADNLIALGFTATTNPFGAGKWPDHFGPFFAKKHIILIPDNDEVGRDHMHRVAENIEAHAVTIKLIKLPDLPEKGDVSDFIKTFSNNEEAAERLAVIIDGAPPYGPSNTVNTYETVLLDPCLKETPAPEHDPFAFPDIMAGAAGRFAEIYSSHLEPAPQFFFMSYLTCLGNLIGDKISLRSEAPSPARLYTILLGESADDRKSTAISKTVKFFRETITDFGVCNGVGSAEGLAKILDSNSQLLLVYDEFKAFVNKSKIESSVLLPCITTLFESDWYENVTVKKTLRIHGAALSMLAACTLETYETIFDQAFIAIGFPNRLFLCPGKSKRKYAFPQKISDSDKDLLKNDLRDVLRHVKNHPEIDISDKARDIYQDWYLSIPGSVHSKRIDAYSMRLMQLLAVNEQKSLIDEDILAKTIKLSDGQLAVRKRFDPVDADSQMARMEEKIRRVLDSGSKRKRDLKRAVHADRAGIWFFENAVTNLEKSEEISYDKETKIFHKN